MRPRKRIVGCEVGPYVIVADAGYDSSDGRKRIVRARCPRCGAEVKSRLDNLARPQTRCSWCPR